MAVVLQPEQVPGLLATGASARAADAEVAPGYQCGDNIRARNINPVGHTRLPRYIRGKRGVVQEDYGPFVFPDTNAHGQGAQAQHLYGVRFEARELWGEDGGARDAVYITLFENYLEPVGSGGAA